MPPSQRLILNSKAYAVASDGKRVITREMRPTNGTDPGRIRTVSWRPDSPIGSSRWSTSGKLATDYTQNLATDLTGQLTSVGARDTITLTSTDPKASSTAYFGGPKFGASATKFGGQVAGMDVTHIAEQGGYLIFMRGLLATQVRISDWTVISTHTFDATVKGAASWFGKVRAGLGGTKAMQSLTGVTSTAQTWGDTQVSGSDVLAKAMVVGTDRLTFVEADQAGTNENKIRYTTDDFATLGNRFQVGDPKVSATGIGAYGPFTHVGSRAGVYTFTDLGKSFPLSTALRGTLSDDNGSQFADPGWGFNYAVTALGLRALTGSTDDPVGIGEAMEEFEGHDGSPTAVFPYAGQLLVAYETSGGDVYVYRSKKRKDDSPLAPPLYPVAYLASTSCKAIFSTFTPTNPELVFGNGTNAFRITQGRGGRYDLDSNYTYSVGGGTWFGTTYDADPHLLKTIRLFRFKTENMVSGDSWTMAVSVDDGSYVNVGSAVTADGYQTLRPVSAGSPQTNVSGRHFKPRLTQVAGGSGSDTAPPLIRGTVEMEYDERPEEVEVVTLFVDFSGQGRRAQVQLAELTALSGSSTNGPIPARIPDTTTAERVMVAGVRAISDIKGPDVTGAEVTLHVWKTA